MFNDVWVNESCYVVERVFSKEQTVKDIVSRRAKAEKGSADWLTYAQPLMYNEPGGSVRM